MGEAPLCGRAILAQVKKKKGATEREVSFLFYLLRAGVDGPFSSMGATAHHS